MDAGDAESLSTEVTLPEEETLSEEVTKLEVNEGKQETGEAESIQAKPQQETNSEELIKTKPQQEANDAEITQQTASNASESEKESEKSENKDIVVGPEKNEEIISQNTAVDRSSMNDCVTADSSLNSIDVTADTEESDGEIVDSDVDDSQDPEPRVDYGGLDDVVRPEFDQLDYDEDVDDGELKDGQGEKREANKAPQASSQEMSDGEIASSDEGEIKSDNEDKKKGNEKAPNNDYEEGEMVDPDGPTVPREICRFFERGNCTWGERCRFIHPGINDKGSYRLFEDEKRPPPMERPPPMDPRGHPMPPNIPPGMMFGPPPPETAWERGLRHAKEMRKKSMQRKNQEPDFMRKREVISLNAALNVDRDMDYIVHKPLVDENSGFDPFNILEEDDRYAVPPPEEIKRYKRFEKIPHQRDGRRSPPGDILRHLGSPRGPPVHPMHRDMHDRNRAKRSPPRHPEFNHPHDRRQPPPMSHRDQRLPPPPQQMRHDRRDMNGERGRHDREKRIDDMRERDYRLDYGRNLAPDDRRPPSPRRRDIESRIVAPPNSSSKKVPGRGDVWNDPWARGRQSGKNRSSRSDSESSSSSSSSSRSSYSSRSSFSSRSSSRSSSSSSYSSSASSRSPSPKQKSKKLVKKKPVVNKPVNQKAKNPPKAGKPAAGPATKPVMAIKKTAEVVKAKLTKPQPVKQVTKPAPPPTPKQPPKIQDRGRPVTKVPIKKGKPKKKSDTSSSSEFSHTSSSESRSRSRSKGKHSESDSETGSSSSGSSGSESYSSSSSLTDSSEDEGKAKPAKKKVTTIKSTAPSAGEKKAIGKVPVPSKPGKKDVKMTIINKAATAKPAAGTASESRKRAAPGGGGGGPPAKKVSAIANRRVELLEQLKVVEKAIMKKRAKLT